MNLAAHMAHETMNLELPDESTWSLTSCYTNFLELYADSIAQFIISLLYEIYIRFTFLNVVIFLLKYLLSTMSVYFIIKILYVASRKRIKQKQMELEDLELQIQILDSKLSVREAKLVEYQKRLHREAQPLRRIRARVPAVIAGDETLRRSLRNSNSANTVNDFHVHSTPKEEREFILESSKELKCDQVAIPGRQSEGMDCGETPQSKSNTDGDSVYSLLNDVDIRQDCRLKIIKVIKVYKVAYLKNYIKQKKLRRATKQMLFKKKMESVKNLLEDWQKALNMVINSKLRSLLMERNLDEASQEAMGDYSKPYETLDSDSDLRNSSSDACYDEYNLSWAQHPYRPYSYNYEVSQETTVLRDCDYQDYDDVKYSSYSDDDYHRCDKMHSIIEETNSQMEIEQIKNDVDSDDCQDIEK